MTATPSRALTVAVLGTTQTLSWGSSYYLPAILAAPMAAGHSSAQLCGLFGRSPGKGHIFRLGVGHPAHH